MIGTSPRLFAQPTTLQIREICCLTSGLPSWAMGTRTVPLRGFA